MLAKYRWLLGTALLVGMALGGAGWLAFRAGAYEPPSIPVETPLPPEEVKAN